MGKTKTKNEYDPKMQALVTGNVAGAQDLAKSYTPYTGQLTAEQSPLMGNFFDAASNIQGAGSSLLGEAAGAARSALGYQPMQIAAPTSQAAQVAGAYTVDPLQALGLLGNTSTAGGVDRSQIRDVNLGAFGADQIRTLYNPFEQDKVNAALGDYERARQMQQNADAAKFGSGAWGGSRQGVDSALTNEAFQRTSQNAANDLRYQGWDSAMNGALAARGQDLQAAMANQGADQYAVGKNADIGMFNSSQQNSMGQFGAGLLGQLQSFNAGQQNQLADSNAGRSQQTSLANQDALLKSLLANQDAGLRGADLTLQGAGLLGNLGQAQSNNALAQTSLLGQAGAAQQGLAQEGLDRSYNAFLQDWQNRLAGQQAVTSATGIVPSVTNSTQTQSQGLGGIAGGLLGSLGTAAFGLGSLGFTPLKGAK